ncbi:hypothetical protein ACTXT7_004784 [Hymenolepis weldensis]
MANLLLQKIAKMAFEKAQHNLMVFGNQFVKNRNDQNVMYQNFTLNVCISSIYSSEQRREVKIPNPMK